jgi:hypothetical protein
MADGPQVDLKAVTAEVSKLSKDQLKEEVLKMRVRQKVQQKKHQGSPKQKEYQARQREKNKLLVAKAKELGIYDAINDEAEELAESKLAEESEQPE